MARLENETPEAEAAPVLAAAHAYQIGAARDEIGDPLARDRGAAGARAQPARGLQNGAGYDTIDVAACTRAGLLAVNQSGGNREAVAEHALAMMLTLSKRIVEIDRRCAARPASRATTTSATTSTAKTMGIIGIGKIGSRIAELCRGLFAHAVLAYDPYLDAAQMAAHGAEKVTLEEMLRARGFRLGQLPAATRRRGA